jgi:hypothetical protein
VGLGVDRLLGIERVLEPIPRIRFRLRG